MSDKAKQPSLPSVDRTFKLAKQFMPYGFGSLWWGRDDLIHATQPEFVEREDRIGHPLVSVSSSDLAGRNDKIPMLVGTSGRNLRRKIKVGCVQVKGLTAEEPDHICYFGSIIAPGLYGFEYLLDGVARKGNAYRRPAKHGKDDPITASEPVPWYELRTTHPNQFKPHVDDGERRALELFCEKNNI